MSCPASVALACSFSLVGASRPWMTPPRVLTAQAATIPSGAHHCVYTRSRDAGCDRGRDVTVKDELRPRPCCADVFDEAGVAFAFENCDSELADFDAFGDQVQVLPYGKSEVNKFARVRSGDQLLHIKDRGGVEHGSAVGHGQDCQGVVHPKSCKPHFCRPCRPIGLLRWPPPR